jgi:hypothetical protein
VTSEWAFPAGKRYIFLIPCGHAEPPVFYTQFDDCISEGPNLIPFPPGVEKYDFSINPGRPSPASRPAMATHRREKPWPPVPGFFNRLDHPLAH